MTSGGLTWWLIIVLLSGCAGHRDVPCVSTPELLKLAVPLTKEYTEFVTHHGEYAPHETGIRHRRSTEQIGCGGQHSPVCRFFLDEGNLTDIDYYTVGVAYKAILMLFTPTEDRLNITVVASSGTVSGVGGGVVVGTATMGSSLITMYTDHLDTTDKFLVVFIHEMLHLFAFGTLSSEGIDSFSERTNPVTLVHSSSNVNACVVEQGGSLPVYTDSGRAHWNMSESFFSSDVMRPIVSFGTSGITKCTTTVVTESRPSWVSNLCTVDADCTGTKTCHKLGSHWISVCRDIPKKRPMKTPHLHGNMFIIFMSIMVVFWMFILECQKRHKERYTIYGD